MRSRYLCCPALAVFLVSCDIGPGEYNLLTHVPATKENIAKAVSQASSEEGGWYDIVFVCTSSGDQHSFTDANIQIVGDMICGNGYDNNDGPVVDRCIDSNTVETVTVQSKYQTYVTPVGFPRCTEEQTN